MEVQFRSADLNRLEADHGFTGGFDRAIVKSYRKKLQAIRAASSEADLYAFKSWRIKKLDGKRVNQRSIRLNDQWLLIVEIEQGNPSNVMVVVAIEDYH